MSTIDFFKRITRSAGAGSADSAMFNFLYGVDTRGSGDMLGLNQDHHGFVFFTKPNLNLSLGNIQGYRKLQYLTDESENSMATAMRSTLMPKRIGSDFWTRGGSNVDQSLPRSPMVDDDLPFIPFLSTSLESLSGWPDELTEWFVSEPGMHKQVTGYVDGPERNMAEYTLNATFIRKENDPHHALFSGWRMYAHAVGDGSINPWPESELEFETDYFTGIYVLLTDANKRYLHKIASTGGGAFVEGLPTGSDFNWTAEQPYNAETNRYSVPLKAFGVHYNDPIIIDNFNDLVCMFNKNMWAVRERPDKNDAVGDSNKWPTYRGFPYLKAGKMVKIPERFLSQEMNNRGYPYINEGTSEIEWWINEPVFKSYVDLFVEFEG